jgi:hypothetical protein
MVFMLLVLPLTVWVPVRHMRSGAETDFRPDMTIEIAKPIAFSSDED